MRSLKGRKVIHFFNKTVEIVHNIAEQTHVAYLLTERAEENLDGSLGDMYDLVVS